jgi:hypothetical protein
MAFNLNSIDKNAKTQGTWEHFQGSEFLIASTSNFAFQEGFQKLQRPHQRQIDKGTLSPEISSDILCRAMADHILLDWRDVEADGKAVPYTKEAAYRALKEHDELRSFVQEVAMDITYFKVKQEEKEVKN